MTNKELLAKAQEHFDAGANKMYATRDGNMFHADKEYAAKLHARSLVDTEEAPEVIELRSGQLEELPEENELNAGESKLAKKKK